MAQASSIEWTELNVEPGDRLHEDQRRVAHCYAERMADRLRAMGQALSKWI